MISLHTRLVVLVPWVASMLLASPEFTYRHDPYGPSFIVKAWDYNPDTQVDCDSASAVPGVVHDSSGTRPRPRIVNFSPSTRVQDQRLSSGSCQQPRAVTRARIVPVHHSADDSTTASSLPSVLAGEVMQGDDEVPVAAAAVEQVAVQQNLGMACPPDAQQVPGPADLATALRSDFCCDFPKTRRGQRGGRWDGRAGRKGRRGGGRARNDQRAPQHDERPCAYSTSTTQTEWSFLDVNPEESESYQDSAVIADIVVDRTSVSGAVDAAADFGAESDAGAEQDAGATEDAGAAKDAGAVEDAGATEDAGAAKDAGAEQDEGAAKDAGVTEDAGAAKDAGVTEDAGATEDAGVTEDAGAAKDAGVTEDAGAIEDAGAATEEDARSGASCDTGACPAADCGVSEQASSPAAPDSAVVGPEAAEAVDLSFPSEVAESAQPSEVVSRKQQRRVGTAAREPSPAETPKAPAKRTKDKWSKKGASSSAAATGAGHQCSDADHQWQECAGCVEDLRWPSSASASPSAIVTLVDLDCDGFRSLDMNQLHAEAIYYSRVCRVGSSAILAFKALWEALHRLLFKEVVVDPEWTEVVDERGVVKPECLEFADQAQNGKADRRRKRVASAGEGNRARRLYRVFEHRPCFRRRLAVLLAKLRHDVYDLLVRRLGVSRPEDFVASLEALRTTVVDAYTRTVRTELDVAAKFEYRFASNKAGLRRALAKARVWKPDSPQQLDALFDSELTCDALRIKNIGVVSGFASAAEAIQSTLNALASMVINEVYMAGVAFFDLRVITVEVARALAEHGFTAYYLRRPDTERCDTPCFIRFQCDVWESMNADAMARGRVVAACQDSEAERASTSEAESSN